MYCNIIVVNNFLFNFDKGKCVVLLGFNGVGKMIILYMIVGFIVFNKGKIFFEDK